MDPSRLTYCVGHVRGRFGHRRRFLSSGIWCLRSISTAQWSPTSVPPTTAPSGVSALQEECRAKRLPKHTARSKTRSGSTRGNALDHAAAVASSAAVCPPKPSDVLEGIDEPRILIFWAVADAFTLLAASARAAEGLAGSSDVLKQSRFRPIEGLSAVISSLPGDTLGLSRYSATSASSTSVAREDHDVEHDDSRVGETRGGRVGTGSATDVGANGACTGTGGCSKSGDGNPVQYPLLSESSALSFITVFLEWASRVNGHNCNRPSSGKGSGGRSNFSAEIVTLGWDAGIGVWMGLTHCLRTLMRTFVESPKIFHVNGALPAVGNAQNQPYPSAEAVALAIFELRRVVGSPEAAARVLGTSPASEVAETTDSPETRTVDGGFSSHDGSRETPGVCRSAKMGRPAPYTWLHRPLPGAMTKGFLKRMNARWKAHLDWGLPDLAPPRRASPRLERNGGGSRRRGNSSSTGRARRADETRGTEDGRDIPQGLKEEAEDLFFSLRGELLRAERLALSTLLNGSTSSDMSKMWVVQAALKSVHGQIRSETHGWRKTDDREHRLFPALRHSPIDADIPSRLPSDCENHGGVSSAGREAGAETGAGQEPEAGSGPSRLVLPTSVRMLRPNKRRQASWSSSQNEPKKSKMTMVEDVSRTACGGTQMGDDNPASMTGEAGHRENLVASAEGEELGRLCRCTAVEMRKGLESGLSVKLTQVRVRLCGILRVRSTYEKQAPTQRQPSN